MSSDMDARSVDKELRRVVWPALRRHGFSERASRVAWRRSSGTDLVEISSVGTGWDQMGCTSFSVSARVAALPDFLPLLNVVPEKEGRPRPHYWHSPLMVTLQKTLSQPWFHPFAEPAPLRMSEPARLHREGLMRVIRRDVHDRPGVWFIKSDGSNIAEVIDDLLVVVEGDGLAILERLHDPAAVIEMVNSGTFTARPGSPVAVQVVQASKARLASGTDVPAIDGAFPNPAR